MMVLLVHEALALVVRVLVVQGALALVAVEEILTLLMVKDLMMQYALTVGEALMVEEVHAVLTFLVVAEALLVQ